MGNFSPQVTAKWLIDRIGADGCPVVIDVRKRPAFEDSGRIIPGAVWRDHELAAQWGGDYNAGDDIVVYCVHGHEVSQGAAEKLRVLGLKARYLADGFEGFEQAGGPVVTSSLPDGYGE